MTDAVVVALVAAAVGMPVTMVALRSLRVVDVPNDRSSHDRPTLRGGGIAVGVAAVAALMVTPAWPSAALVGLAVAAGGFGSIGLADDTRRLPAEVRLALQAAVAVAALPWLLAGVDGPAWRTGVVAAVAFLWLVSYVNAFNFMDGINGISVAQVVVAAAAWYVAGRLGSVPVVADAALVVGVAVLVFAPFNFPTARLFLGDVGSYLLGAWLAALVVIGVRGGLPPEAMMAPLSLYLADTSSTLLRRILAGEDWTRAHRDHTYQRLVRLGWSHARTTAVVGTLLLVLGALGAVSLTGVLPARVLADAAGAALLGAYLGAPRVLARRRLQADAPAGGHRGGTARGLSDREMEPSCPAQGAEEVPWV